MSKRDYESIDCHRLFIEGGLMEKQIEVAVDWWANQLANGARQDNGDAATNFFTAMVSASIPLASEAQENGLQHRCGQLCTFAFTNPSVCIKEK
jgi:hypothetical protein